MIVLNYFWGVLPWITRNVVMPDSNSLLVRPGLVTPSHYVRVHKKLFVGRFWCSMKRSLSGWETLPHGQKVDLGQPKDDFLKKLFCGLKVIF